VEAKAARGAQLLEKQKIEEAKQPSCNSRWSQDEGGEVCTVVIICYHFFYVLFLLITITKVMYEVIAGESWFSYCVFISWIYKVVQLLFMLLIFFTSKLLKLAT